METPLKVASSSADFGGSADYVAEMARQIAYEQYKEETYTRGIKVITTIIKTEQEAAHRALRRGIMDYDRRHGYRGAESYADPARLNTQQTESMDEILSETPDYDDMLAAIVIQAGGGAVTVYRYGESIRLSGDGLRFAASSRHPPLFWKGRRVAHAIRVAQRIRVAQVLAEDVPPAPLTGDRSSRRAAADARRGAAGYAAGAALDPAG